MTLTASERYTASKLYPSLGSGTLPCAFETKTNICQNGKNFEDLACTYQQARYKVTDLESEVCKARFYEKHQCRVYWTFSSTQAKSLHDECTVTPARILHGEPLDQVSFPHTETHHNLYAIIIVVTAFVSMESVMPAVVRDMSRFEFT